MRLSTCAIVYDEQESERDITVRVMSFLFWQIWAADGDRRGKNMGNGMLRIDTLTVGFGSQENLDALWKKWEKPRKRRFNIP